MRVTKSTMVRVDVCAGVYYITQHAGGSEYLTNILDMEPKQGVKDKDRITDMDAHNTVVRAPRIKAAQLTHTHTRLFTHCVSYA